MKKVLSILALIILIISSILPFIGYQDNYIYTYEVIGFAIVVFCISLHIYSIFQKSKYTYYATFAGTLLGYIISTIKVYEALEKYDFVIDIKIGAYIYGLALIPLIISLFVSNEEKNENINIITNDDNNKKYLIAMYLYGIKNRPELANRQCALTYKDNLLNVKIVKDNNIEEYNIPLNTITSIKVKPSTTMVSKTYSPQEDQAAIQLLAVVMFGSVGNIVGEVVGNGMDSISTKRTTVFLTEINYKNEANEDEKIVIQSNILEKEFFKDLESIYSIEGM